MDFFDLLKMVGGLALFLYGMNLLGDGLSQASGGRLERILEKLTNNPIKAVLMGAVVTGVLLVAGIFGNSDRIAADSFLHTLLIDVKAVALLMDADEISGVAEQGRRRRRSC